jgi:hypothetical protein
MARSSCITHSPRQQMVIIREDYLRIADNNHCAAALLNIFEYWHNVKLAEQDQALIEKEIAKAGGAPLVDAELWVYKSIPDFQEEVLGLFGETKISAALKLLHEKGFIESRNNPKYGWDRTLQYLFIVDIVQAAILSFPSRKSTASTNRKNKASKTLNSRDASVKNKAAIPETTTETTTKNDSSGRKRSPLQQANDALVNAIGAALGIPAVGKDYSNYLAQAKELVAAGIAQDEFTQYVEWMKALSKTTGNWDVTINALTTGGRMSKYIVRRKSAAPAISDTPTDPTELQRELEAELARNLNYGALMTGGGK